MSLLCDLGWHRGWSEWTPDPLMLGPNGQAHTCRLCGLTQTREIPDDVE